MSEDQGKHLHVNNANSSQDQSQFNSLSVHASNQKTQVQDSLVPDLMKVYESMTQSSTPQDTAANAPPNHAAPTNFPEQQPIQQTHTTQNSCEAYQQYHQVPVSGQHPQQEGYYNQSTQQQEFYPPYSGSFQDQSLVSQASTYPLPSLSDPPLAPSRKAAPTNPENSGRSSRKRSFDRHSETKEKNNRKKSNDRDSRWSKRFTWPDDLHRDFVSTIFDVGLKHSSPSAILEHMPAHEQITSERVKSHLQKYRLHRNKSKKEFMSSYDASLKKIRSGGVDRNSPLSDGQVAAHLTFSMVNEADIATGGGPNSHDNDDELAFGENSQQTKDSNSQLGKLALPRLTEEEKKSPIGTSLGHLMGLFFSLNQQLMSQRAAKEAIAATGFKHSSDYSSTTGKTQNSSNALSMSQVPNHAHPAYDSHQPQFKDNMYQPPTSHDVSQIPPTAHHQEQAVENDEKAHASTRTNFEENKLMKKEMENQMFFQNKMRDLKQRELNKYKPTQDPTSANSNKHNDLNHMPSGKKTEERAVAAKNADSTMKYSQGPGENADADEEGDIEGRSRGISIGATDEFWNTDVVDEQLFEFLMNP